MVLKFCLPAIDHALGTASRLAVSGSQGTRRRSLPRRAARRYIAIPGAPRGRLSRPPRFLHIRQPRRAPRLPGGPAPPPGPAAGRPWEIAGAPGSRRGGARKAKRSGAPEGPAPHLYGSAVHRSAAPCSPTGFPRSTIGARRLSFRVRNGSGRAPPAMAADRWAALRPPRGGYVCPGGPSCPGGRTARRWTLGLDVRSDRKHRAAPVPSETAPAAI